MKLCKICLYPDTKPDLTFEDGVCAACINARLKDKINWDNRRYNLERILSLYKGDKPWNCIIPVSGGKDSHFITHTMKEMGMNPLLVCFVPNDQTELGRKNLDNLKKAFDCDCIEFYAQPSTYHHLQKKRVV